MSVHPIHLWLTGIIILLTHAAKAQTEQEKEVIKADATLNGYILKKDREKAATFYATDFVLTTSSGKTKSKEDILNEIVSPEIEITINNTNLVQVRIIESTAVLTGVLHQKGIYKGKPFDVQLLVTDTWVKTTGGWKILAGHASMFPVIK